MPVIIEFSRCIGTYSSAKFEIFILKINKEIGDGVDATYGLKGTVAKWGNMSGGAVQVVTPFGGDILEKIGILKEY